MLAFFGFAACAGSAYVQHRSVPASAWWGSLVVGLPACAVLLANNIRDAEGDEQSGKRTLAVRFGRPFARRVFVACFVGAGLAVVLIAIETPFAALGLLAAPLGIAPIQAVLHRVDPPGLVVALVGTVRFTVAIALLTTVGLVIG